MLEAERHYPFETAASVMSCKFIEHVRTANNRSLAGRPLGPARNGMIVLLLGAAGQPNVSAH
jgi:hypothetical protein